MGAVLLLKNCLALDPDKRFSAVQILNDSYFASLHNEASEKSCDRIPSVLTPEEEASCQTEFGLRHVMFEALTSYHARTKLQNQQKALKRKQKKPTKAKTQKMRNSVKQPKKSTLPGVRENEPGPKNVLSFAGNNFSAGGSLLESLNEE